MIEMHASAIGLQRNRALETCNGLLMAAGLEAGVF